MYKRPAEALAVPTESKRSWLFLAVCCLGLVGVLSASTFVLSIINTYLSGKPVTVTNIVDNDVFYLRYLSFVNESTSLTGSLNELQSLSEIEQRINQGMSSPDEGIKITYGTSQTTFLHRRRHLTYDPYRRDITTEVVFHCEYKYKENCLSQDCRWSARQRINNNIKKTGTLLNVLLVTANEQFGTQVSSTTLVFSEILQQTQTTFKTIREAEDAAVGSNIKKRAASTTTTVSFCTAVKSGSFSDAKIWKSGTVPSGKCSIVIPSGFTVTFTGELFSVQVPKLIVQGSFVVSSTTSITFKYAISIVVEATGSFKDQSSQHKLYFLPGSSFIFYSGASFVGSGTVAYTYLTIPASGSAGSNVKFGSQFTGPFTFISTNAGNVNNSGSSTYIVAKSGAFTAKSTWLGACVPTSSLCTSLKPCTLYIPSGCALTTADLKGKFDINFNEIVVDSGATFSLGTAGLSAGFQFKYSFTFTIRGILGFAASGGNIQLPWGCAFNFFSGASFSSKLTCQIQSYNPSSTSATATLLTLSSTYKSSFFVSVSLTGVKTISTTYVTAVPPGGTTAVVRTTTKAPTTKPVTTTKAPTTTVWTVIKSGSFTDAKIWKSGTVPSGKCTVIIPSGFTVTFTGDIFTYQVTTLTIGGTFVFSSTTSITFKYAISIVVEATGSFKDQSSQHKIYFLGGSFCTFYSGASFLGSGTIAYYYKTLPASGSFGAKYTLGSKFSGPFTFLISLSGEIKNFASLTFIASGSGGFLSKSTWFGGLVPSASLCSLLGCRLYIPKGCAVTTAELKGTLDINFNEISVDSGATFSLGTAGLSGGFRFKHRFTFNIRGILGFASPSGSIELPWGCAFNFFSGASFSSSRTCQVRTYNPSSWTVGSMLLSLSASYKSAFFCGVSLLGVKTISKTEVTAIPIVTTTAMVRTTTKAVTTTKAPTTTVWTVIKSGSFTDAKIWKSGTVPSGKCTVIIPSGFTVTFTGDIFTYQVTTLTIGGTFVFSSTTSITFKYAISIVVEATGSFKDQSSQHKIYFLGGSFCTFYSGASFLGSGTIAYYYKTLPASGSFGAKYTLGSKFSGPFTFLISLSGEIKNFASLTFIASGSGGFLSKSTWFGGLVPSASLCSLLGCRLYIPKGCAVTTAELKGTLDINFNEISVDSGATFSLGTVGLSGGFRFKYRFTFNIRGILGFASPSGSIELPWGCAFNFFSGASFSSSRTCQVRTYNPSSWTVGSMLLSLSASYKSAFFCGVSLLGVKTISKTEVTAIPSVTTTTAKPSTGSVWTVIKSGSFTDAKIWKSGTVPSGKCTVIIPSGFTVTFTGDIFTYQVTTLTIGGSFVVSSTGGCAFKYAINIVVQATGSFKDQTSLHRLYFLAGSYFNFYSGGSFLGSGSVAYYYKTLPASGSLGASYKLGSKFSGPFTFIVLLSGSIRSFGTASFIATASGGFLSKSTWAGGVIPSTSLCTLLHACSLYIPSGYVITTAELNGLLDMNFKEIVVESGATLTLGTAGVSGGFRFKYALTLSILGVLGFASPSGSIELPWLSAFNFFSGARYSSSRTAQVRTYNPLTWSVGSMLIELSSSYTGSYYVSVSLLGFKKVSSTPIGF